jgi:Putative peptidoglycan binding domain
MRLIKGTFVGLFLASILALAPTAAFAHGGGGGGGHGGGGGFGGGHGGGFGGGHFGGGGGHFGGGASHFVGGGGHFTGFSGHSFAGHSFAGRNYGDHFRNGDHFRHEGGFFFGGDPYWYDYPYYGYYGYDYYPYYGYDDNTGDYYDGQYSPAEATPSQETIVAVQKELAQLGYYHGQVDGLMGPQTEKAIRWFQSVDKIAVTGQIDNPTLKALRIS